jgi:hypothetical protein
MHATVWELAEKCWAKDSKSRPSAIKLYDDIVKVLGEVETAGFAHLPP